MIIQRRPDPDGEYNPFNKRSYLPYTLTTHCQCGAELEIDLTQDYIMDFKMGDVEVQFFCEKCYDYTFETVNVEVTITEKKDKRQMDLYRMESTQSRKD